MIKIFILSTSVAAIVMATTDVSKAAEHVEVGVLDCDVGSDIGAIIGGLQGAKCVFKPSAGGLVQQYSGTINEFGIDIGEVSAAKMDWLVYAPTSRNKAPLAGTYSGVTADVAVGIGLGADVLVGGENGTVSLQPISITGEQGVNIAIGVTSLNLRVAK